MSSDDRIDGLERRIAALESLVRELVRPDAATPRPLPNTTSPRDLRNPIHTQLKPAPVDRRPDAVPRPAGPPLRPLNSTAKPVRDTEQWIGQRGLLAVGVVLLILAAAYMLKLAFDRGWISPAMRCLGGFVAGLFVGVVGWRQYGRGLRTYGAALIGTGAAIIYLVLWAAARLYALIPSGLGITGLAIVSLFLSFIAFRLNIEALGAAAAVGTLFAPIVIGSEPANADVLLVYLAVAGTTLGAVALYRVWRLTTALVALSYFGLGMGAAESGSPWGSLLFAIVGGVAGLTIGLSRIWPETRFIAFGGAWGILWTVAGPRMASWAIAAAGIILAIPIWWHALRSPRIWPDPAISQSDTRWSFGESFYFYLTPLLVSLGIVGVAPEWFGRHEGLLWVFVGLPYAVAGFNAVRVPFALAGTTLLGLAALSEWAGVQAVWALALLSGAWAVMDHIFDRTDGRWYALLALFGALVHLVSYDLVVRGDGPGFRDLWALSLWLLIIVTAALAAGLWRRRGSYGEPAPVAATPSRSARTGTREYLELGRSLASQTPAALWILAGILVFGGVTGELMRFVSEWDLPSDTARLVSGLSVSAWWALFAGALVMFGFLRDLRPVRIAGLLVAGLAVIKVVFFDLASLDALYRVGSVFILGVVSLVVAYLYHVHARKTADASTAEQDVTTALQRGTAQE